MNWKENHGKLAYFHQQITEKFGRLSSCENCGKEKNLEWSNKDHKYSEDRNDWQYLCRGCHIRYDFRLGLRNNLNKIGMKLYRGINANRGIVRKNAKNPELFTLKIINETV